MQFKLILCLLIALFFTGCYPTSTSRIPAWPPDYDYDTAYQLYNAGDYEGTVNVCDGLLETYPEDTDLLLYRSKSLVMLDRTDEALADAQRLVRLEPYNMEFKSNLGWVANSAYEYEIAAGAYDEIIKATSYNNANAYNGRAWANVQLGRLDTVLEDVNKAIDAEPYNDAYIDTRAVYYLKSGDLKNAMIDINQSIEISPTDPEHHYHKGLIYIELNDWINAYDEFTLCKRYKPNFRDIDDYLELADEKVVEIFEEANSDEEDDNSVENNEIVEDP